MGRGKPINADMPPAARPQATPKPAGGAATPGAPLRRGRSEAESERPKPPAPALPGPVAEAWIRGAPWAIGGMVLLAAVFVVAAILGGRGGEETPTGAAPAPVSAPGSEGGGNGGEDGAAQTAERLGYPSFATNNTTRVGGADPAANAAAIALAVYPSATPAQRPDAVALVDGVRWQNAVAAAVLMAAPVRAPLLVAGTSDPPEATAQALAALDPRGSARTRDAQAFAVGGAAVPEDMEAIRVRAPGAAATAAPGDPEGTGTAGEGPAAGRGDPEGTGTAGEGPAATAAALAALRERLAGKPPAHFVLAPVADPGFAAPAAAWAARSGDPVLYADRDSLPAATAAALRRHPDVPVYVLGPPATISSAVARRVARIGSRARRVSGEDPIANAIALARYDDGDFGWDVNDPGHGFVVARSDSPLEAALAAPLSASGSWGPLLLTDSADTLPAAMRDYLLDIKPGYTTDPTRAFYNHVWVIGDQEAIAVGQQAELDELAEVAPVKGTP
jgi:hypothetical protein